MSCLIAVLVASIQTYWIFPYLPLAPKEVLDAGEVSPRDRITLLAANVKQGNRKFHRVLELVRVRKADVIIFCEVNDEWMERLSEIRAAYPWVIARPQNNTYGIACFSKLPLERDRVRFLVKDDIPSLDFRVRMRNGHQVRIFAVHPEPPRVGRDSTARDAELVLVGREVAESSSAIVLGDLNDVGWSRTTNLFQEVSRLLDPRKGRGLFATFHADYPLLRYPLDYIFHSRDFRVVSLDVLPDIGSDHFPLYAELSYEPQGRLEQMPPDLDPDDREDATETLEDAGIIQPGR
jgi:endonuclease/exonuclease/phosphatase (EEP) superfamily protein YafD